VVPLGKVVSWEFYILKGGIIRMRGGVREDHATRFLEEVRWVL